MSNYITEAFKQLNLLEDVEEVKDISLDASGIGELRSFLDDAAVDPDEEMIDVYDLQAEAEEDLQKSYEGKVILECTVCHSNIFEDPENISIDEDGKACMDLECPYCMSNEGYYIIGEVAPYSENATDEEEPVEDTELDEVNIEGAADEIDDEDIIEESCNTKKLKEDWDEEFEIEYDSIINDNSLTETDRDRELEKLYAYYGMNESMKLDFESYKNKSLKEDIDYITESLNGYKNKSLKEAIEDISVSTENETMTMTTKEDGGVVIETSPKSEDEFEEFGDIEVEAAELESGDEMIAPISDETSEIIDASSDALDTEDEESFDEIKADMEDEEIEDDMPTDDEDDFADLEDFDEKSFDGLGESYLRNCYDNVKGFKTSNVATKNNRLFIEGIIKFDSGNEKKTNFVFNPIKIKNNKYKFEGYNKEISRGKKTFKLSGALKNNKLVCESLNYNYRSKNELNESVRVYGTIKRK